MNEKPPFIISTEDVPETSYSYPNSSEKMAFGRAIGKAAGLLKFGLHIKRMEPGQRSSWPHAEEKEEEFVYVLQGQVEVWIDGHTYEMNPGDLAAFPSGTGICHTFINNSEKEVLLFVGGECSKSNNRIYYPLHSSRKNDMPWSHWWDGIPLNEQGSHDGKPDRLRDLEKE